MKCDFVLLPGLHGTSGLFLPLLKIFPAKALDLPKSGPQDYATLSAWLASRRFPQKYILVGESFAGPLALLHAARQPKGLKGVVLLGSFARMGLPLARLLSYLIPPLPLASHFFRKINQRALFSGEASGAQLDFFQSEVRQTSPWIFRARFQEVMRGDVRHCLAQIKVPVLSVRARRDQMVPGLAEDDLKAIPGLRQAGVDSPHVIAGTHPRQLARIMKRFEKSL